MTLEPRIKLIPNIANQVMSLTTELTAFWFIIPQNTNVCVVVHAQIRVGYHEERRHRANDWGKCRYSMNCISSPDYPSRVFFFFNPVDTIVPNGTNSVCLRWNCQIYKVKVLFPLSSSHGFLESKLNFKIIISLNDRGCLFKWLLCRFSDINECASGPCRNGGSCSNLVNRFVCSCSPEYGGVYCQAGACASSCNML